MKGNEITKSDSTEGTIRVGIIGAGAAGKLFLKVILGDRKILGYEPIIFIDDDTRLVGRVVDDIPVDGPISQLSDLVSKYSLELVLITIPSAPGEIIRRIVKYCNEAKISYRVVPPAYTNLQISGVRRPRRVAIEDLLSVRPKRILDESTIKNLKSKTILVTGAAGSIGSEIVRQLNIIHPEKILALDISESGLYNLEAELRQHNPESPIEIILCDIRNKTKLEQVFNKYNPTLIFHAAAYKHVPMLEIFPDEAVVTNIQGSLNVIEATSTMENSRLVVISTDKAVEPFNVMGMTKRIVELLVKCAVRDRNEMFVVRFGNVIESNGSVIPLFKRQIQEGGPVTVTHPDVERYFMTTSEAAQLVIQTSLLGKNRCTYVLKMGEQRKILDLAKDMIMLAGLEEGRDIEIKFIGLRKGEKLSEKLFCEEEKQNLLANSMIYEVENNEEIPCDDFLEKIHSLLNSYINLTAEEIKRRLESILN